MRRLLLTFIAFIPSLALALPPEYTATYEIKKYGIVVAESNYTLRHENGGVRMTQHTEPVGFAALLRDDVLDEDSFLTVQNDQLLLSKFSFKQKSPDKKNRDIELSIDWKYSDGKLLGQVSGTAKGKTLTLKRKLTKPVWDTSSYQIPLMQNTKAGGTPQTITMMVKGGFRHYTFITHETKKIEINGNTINTIKVERRIGDAGKNPIYLWLAPELNNLPIKIEKWKNGELELTLLLSQASFPKDENKAFEAEIDKSEVFDDF